MPIGLGHTILSRAFDEPLAAPLNFRRLQPGHENAKGWDRDGRPRQIECEGFETGLLDALDAYPQGLPGRGIAEFDMLASLTLGQEPRIVGESQTPVPASDCCMTWRA